MKKLIWSTLVVCSIFFAPQAFAQDDGWQVLPLDDMHEFKPQAGNWFVVSDVSMDRHVDVHAKPAPAPEGKKGKKKKSEPEAKHPEAVTYTNGKGVLLNINDDTKKSNLLTTWEHGDLELELEVMLPKGSNSGIYLQGRYEIQLADSWQEKTAKFSDIGGIYRNWETETDKMYMGKAPITNAAKAPGLWQKFKISFRAPRFDASGKKIANAEFISVELNGVKIHDHVEVPLPTGGPVENNETAMGPLMIQGDHGPVAMRNIRYKLMHESQVSLSGIKYKAYQGNINSTKDLASLKPTTEGSVAEISSETAGVEDAFGVVFNGTISIPEDAHYNFHLNFNGGATLSVNNQLLIGPGLERNDGKADLKKGEYPFELTYFKNVTWKPARLAFYVSSTNTHAKSLHAFNSFPPDADMYSPIIIRVGSKPRMLRAFLDFQGDRSKRLTHTIGVGEPGKIHYVYDLKSGNLVCTWRGDFVNATPMWHDRGDGSFRPMGSIQYLFTSPSLAQLASPGEAFPATSNEENFRGKGYVLDENGRPVFKYIYKGVEVTDKIYPDAEDKIFNRELNFKNSVSGLYYKLAEGKSISTMPDGSFAINDKEYYIQVTSGKPVVRDAQGKKELVVPVDGNDIKYSIIW